MENVFIPIPLRGSQRVINLGGGGEDDSLIIIHLTIDLDSSTKSTSQLANFSTVDGLTGF